MKIRIGTNNNLTFTENEKHFLKLLEEDTIFEEFIKRIRRIVKLPENLVSEQPEVDEHTKQIVASLAILLADIFNNLSTHWYETFASIIMTGTAIPSEYKKADAINYQFEEESPSDEPYRKALTITIHTCTTRNGIKKFLSDNKEEIDAFLKKLPKDHNIKIKDIDLKKEVSKLKKLTSENTYSKITDTLRDTYGDNLPEQFNEYDKLSIYNKRYKTDVQNILKKNQNHMKILEETLAQLKKALQ